MPRKKNLTAVAIERRRMGRARRRKARRLRLRTRRGGDNPPPLPPRDELTGFGRYRKKASGMPRAGRAPRSQQGLLEDLGEMFLGGPGKILGGTVEKMLPKLLGNGAYRYPMPKRNSIIYSDMSPPMVKNKQRGEGFCVDHREYLGDLTTGSGNPSPFIGANYLINPGNPELFPWLSTIAQNFEEYEFNGLVMVLKSLASETSTTLSLGSMFSAVQYDVNDPLFTDKQEVENYEYAMSDKPSGNLMLPVECARALDTLTHLYVAQNGMIPAGADPLLYYLGNLFIGSAGCPASLAPIAEIWISYQVTFYKPKLGTGGTLGLDLIGLHGYTTTAVNGNPFAGMIVQPGYNWNDEAQTIFLGNQFFFPESFTDGIFLVVFNFSGGSTALTQPTITAAGCTLDQLWVGDSATKAFMPLTGVSAAAMIIAIVVNISAKNASLTFSGGVYPTTANCDVFATQLPGGILT